MILLRLLLMAPLWNKTMIFVWQCWKHLRPPKTCRTHWLRATSGRPICGPRSTMLDRRPGLPMQLPKCNFWHLLATLDWCWAKSENILQFNMFLSFAWQDAMTLAHGLSLLHYWCYYLIKIHKVKFIGSSVCIDLPLPRADSWFILRCFLVAEKHLD